MMMVVEVLSATGRYPFRTGLFTAFRFGKIFKVVRRYSLQIGWCFRQERVTENFRYFAVYFFSH